MTDNYKPQQSPSLALWLVSIITLGGIVYFWVQMGEADFWLKVIAAGIVGILWFGVVMTVVGILAALLGLGSIAVGPFRKR